MLEKTLESPLDCKDPIFPSGCEGKLGVALEIFLIILHILLLLLLLLSHISLVQLCETPPGRGRLPAHEPRGAARLPSAPSGAGGPGDLLPQAILSSPGRNPLGVGHQPAWTPVGSLP